MLFLPKEVETVISTLQGAGYSPYLVGGCVREMLRGKAPSDYDMTSDALPQEVLRLFSESAHPTGLQHGTVTVVSGGLPIELTTMRRDGAYRDNRHPDSVTFGTSIEEDLARRDFTVNAIALSPDGTIVDPYGGQEDLKAGVLRCVGEPKRRFEEDALRILRLVRFCSVLGFSAEKETARAAHEARGLLAHVAHERVYAEMNKLLLGENVGETLLTFPDILGVPIPEISPCVGFDQCNYHHCFDVWGHTARAVAAVPPKRELRWTMLFHDLGKPLCRTFDEQGIGHFTATRRFPLKWRRTSWRGCTLKRRCVTEYARSSPVSTICSVPSRWPSIRRWRASAWKRCRICFTPSRPTTPPRPPQD